MTRGSGRTRLVAGVGALVAALALLLASPAQPEAASADCGDNTGPVCWENEACADILFYDHCTTEYKYFPQGPPEEGGAASGLPDDAGLLPGVGDGDGCSWGDDYIGWEPRGC